jgi:hypothetical protein
MDEGRREYLEGVTLGAHRKQEGPGSLYSISMSKFIEPISFILE